MTQIRLRPPGSPWRVVWIGQSYLLSPFPFLGGPESIPAVAMSGRKVPWHNAAVNAAGWDDWISTHLEAECLPQLGRAAADLVILGISGQSDIWDDASGATVYDRMVTISETIKASFPSTHILATTLTGNATNTGDEETARGDLNTLVLADAEGAFDTVLDVDVAPMADFTDATYYSASHPTAAGCAAFAAMFASSLSSILV